MARFVIFDLFHTLINGAGLGWEGAVAEVAAIAGVEPGNLLAAYRETFAQRQVQWDSEQTVRILAERAGGHPSQTQVAQAAAARRTFARNLIESARPETIRALDALRDAGYRLGLVSNASADTSESWPGSRLAARFDVAIFSCEVGAAKPDPRIYLAATTALGAQPAQCYFVGDGANSELTGAASLGMTAIRTTEHSDSDPSWQGVTISSLAALSKVLVRHPPGTRPAGSAQENRDDDQADAYANQPPD